MDVYKLDKFEHIYAVDCFDKEFSKMTNERLSDEPPYPRFQKWLISRLSILDKMGKNAIKLEGFEDLASNNPKLFSIRYPHSKLNPRVIYACSMDSEIILLTAFKEENAKSDYSKAMKKAAKRYKTLDSD